jgi:hypothetical protein
MQPVAFAWNGRRRSPVVRATAIFASRRLSQSRGRQRPSRNRPAQKRDEVANEAATTAAPTLRTFAPSHPRQYRSSQLRESRIAVRMRPAIE